MLTYFFYRMAKSIKVPRARRLLDKNLSRKKTQIVLTKTGVELAGECTIKPPFFYEFGRLDIGDDVFINAGCVFLDNAKIKIGEQTLIGPNVTLTTASHPVEPKNRKEPVIALPITIGKNVWLGAGAVVLQGVSIGNNSVVAANSVVTSDIPDNVLVAGSPAVIKRKI